jgi:hypothetical protein
MKLTQEVLDRQLEVAIGDGKTEFGTWHLQVWAFYCLISSYAPYISESSALAVITGSVYLKLPLSIIQYIVIVSFSSVFAAIRSSQLEENYLC